MAQTKPRLLHAACIGPDWLLHVVLGRRTLIARADDEHPRYVIRVSNLTT